MKAAYPVVTRVEQVLSLLKKFAEKFNLKIVTFNKPNLNFKLDSKSSFV